MRYTRVFEVRGENWGPLASLQVGKVVVGNAIPEKKIEEDGLSSKLKGGIRTELGVIAKRWGTSRQEDADHVDRPLSTSLGWVDIQLGTKGGRPVNWEEWGRKRKKLSRSVCGN